MNYKVTKKTKHFSRWVIQTMSLKYIFGIVMYIIFYKNIFYSKIN